jgi:hypothetical protein
MIGTGPAKARLAVLIIVFAASAPAPVGSFAQDPPKSPPAPPTAAAPPRPQGPAAAPAAPVPPAPPPPPSPPEPDDEAEDPRPSRPAAAQPPPEPLKRQRYDAAILQGVDKITAETLRFEAKVGEPLRYKGLILTVRACETTAPDEPQPDAIAHLEVLSQPEGMAGRLPTAARMVFRGWMYASSPTLHPFEHPVYDLWLIACKTASPVG